MGSRRLRAILEKSKIGIPGPKGVSCMSSYGDFAHLHVHSQYSLLDGSARISELVSQAKALGMRSLALTDHGVMHGIVEFYREAKAQGVHPVLGCEVYVAPESRHIRERSQGSAYHLVLLAENNEGYKNLLKLCSLGFLEGFYYRPRVDLELMREYSHGIICLSACIAGPIARTALEKSYEAARDLALEYNEVFGRGNFFLELQDFRPQKGFEWAGGSRYSLNNSFFEEQERVNEALLRISKETGIPLVASNDVHYTYRDDAEAHDVLLCIQTNKSVEDDGRIRFPSSEFYLKSPQEMAEVFKGYPGEMLTNTAEIAKRCQVELDFDEYRLPRYKTKDGADTGELLRQACLDGLANRYGDISSGGVSVLERLEYELETIKKMDFEDYFLIVGDFVRYAREKGIMVGPGRGSAAGSIVAYALGITNIDPIKHGLLFERFLNPERVSMPDIDIDFCYERRQEVIDYVVEKFGSEHVAQIITFGTMGARAVVRDVGRALGMAYKDVDSIAKMVPSELGITLERALEINTELAQAVKAPEAAKLFAMARRLEGLVRHASTHAAGVVICSEALTDYVPLSHNDGVVTTQFPMGTLEELGLLKMDFLGLRTLTVIQNSVLEVERRRGIKIDIDNIGFDDSGVYRMIAEGDTEGVFQLESSGMKSFMRELSPGCFEDIVAGISLFRPGPMEFIPKYIRGKNGDPSVVSYSHESLRSILESTYGCIVYQEQVMQIVQELAGYSLARADMVRKVMSKKQTDVMERERKSFIYGNDEVPGCVKNGISEDVARRVFDEMADFAKYAFNKSHAAAYAVVGYQTAWLKLNYPVEFMAALMSSVGDSSVKVTEYAGGCRKMGISLLPPDINKGFANFSVGEDGASIRYGLLAIKNVGRSAIEALVKEREEGGKFASLSDFVARLGTRELNKRCVESLIAAGALDSLGGSRLQYTQILGGVLEGASEVKRRNIEGQLSLEDVMSAGKPQRREDILPGCGEYPYKELLEMERSVLGLYLSGHPLQEYEGFIEENSSVSSMSFEDESPENRSIKDGDDVRLAGIISKVQINYTRGGKPMAFFTLEDLLGSVEVVVFPNVYEKYIDRLVQNAVVAVSGRAAFREDEDGKLLANSIKFYGDMNSPSQELWLKRKYATSISDGDISRLLREYPGSVPVILFEEESGKVLRLPPQLYVDPCASIDCRLRLLLGEDAVVLRNK